MIEDFMTVEEAMETGLIPESYHNLFSHYKVCDDPHCGAPLIINKTRVVMKCSNIKCIRILASRLLKVYTYFGKTNFGPQSAYDYVLGMSITTIPDAMKRCPEDIKDNINRWINTPHTLGQVIELLAIPNIGTKAHKMMNGIPDWNTFTRCIEAYGVIIVLAQCGIHGKLNVEWWTKMKRLVELGCSWEKWSNVIKSNSATKTMPYNSFNEFNAAITIYGLKEIFRLQLGGTGRDGEDRAEDFFLYMDEIKELSKMIVSFIGNVTTQKLVITGDIVNVTKPDGTPYERLEFVNFINTLAIKYNIQFENSTALKTTNYIIADYPSSTRKYREALASGKLISSDKFIELILRGEING